MSDGSRAGGGSSIPTLSVIIPTRKRQQALSETLASVLSTDSPADEVLVIDGDAERSARPVVEGARDSAPSVFATSWVLLDRLANVISDFDTPPGMSSSFSTMTWSSASFFSLLRANYSSGVIVGATGRVLEPAAHRMGGEGAGVRRLVFRRTRPGAFTSSDTPPIFLGRPRENANS